MSRDMRRVVLVFALLQTSLPASGESTGTEEMRIFTKPIDAPPPPTVIVYGSRPPPTLGCGRRASAAARRRVEQRRSGR
jgi:hypothetical protein